MVALPLRGSATMHVEPKAAAGQRWGNVDLFHKAQLRREDFRRAGVETQAAKDDGFRFARSHFEMPLLRLSCGKRDLSVERLHLMICQKLFISICSQSGDRERFGGMVLRTVS